MQETTNAPKHHDFLVQKYRNNASCDILCIKIHFIIASDKSERQQNLVKMKSKSLNIVNNSNYALNNSIRPFPS